MRWRNRNRRIEIPGYAEKDWKSDVRHGRRDGRKLLPAYGDVLERVQADVSVSTPYHRVLMQAGVHEISERYRSYLDQIDGFHRRVAGLETALTVDEKALLRLQDELAKARAELTESDLAPRSPHEIPLAGTPELRGRRAWARDQRVAAVQRELDRRMTAIDTRRREIVETSAMIDEAFALAKAHGQQVADHYVVRISAYWDALVQKHAEGRNLASILPTITVPSPAWMKRDSAPREETT